MAFDGKDYIRWGVNIYDEEGDMCGFYHDEKPYILRDGLVYNWGGKIRGCIEDGSVVWKKLELREHDGKFYERREFDIYDEDEKVCGFYFDWKAYIIKDDFITSWDGRRCGFVVDDAIIWGDINDLDRVTAILKHWIAPAPPPPSPIAKTKPLPYGWIERVSEKVHKGDTYYVNWRTKEKTWTRPLKDDRVAPWGLIETRKAYRARVV
jgi:hypothetical protein